MNSEKDLQRIKKGKMTICLKYHFTAVSVSRYVFVHENPIFFLTDHPKGGYPVE
jgi:hypothetical protein